MTMEISCRHPDYYSRYAASAFMHFTRIRPARIYGIDLVRNTFFPCGFCKKIPELSIGYQSGVMKSYLRAFSHPAVNILRFYAGKIIGYAAFEHYGRIRVDRKGSCFCSAEANFFLGGSDAINSVRVFFAFQIIQDFYHNRTAGPVIKSFPD